MEIGAGGEIRGSGGVAPPEREKGEGCRMHGERRGRSVAGAGGCGGEECAVGRWGLIIQEAWPLGVLKPGVTGSGQSLKFQGCSPCSHSILHIIQDGSEGILQEVMQSPELRLKGFGGSTLFKVK